MANTLEQIEEELLLHLRANDTISLQRIERILICLLGHPHTQCREFSARLLNVLYDGHDWQLKEALVPVIRTVDDSFVIEVDLVNPSLDPNNIFFLLYSPTESGKYMLSRHLPGEDLLRFMDITVSQFGRAPNYASQTFLRLREQDSMIGDSHL